MSAIEIPGLGPLSFRHVLIDMNGTLARDGVLLPGTVELLTAVSDRYHCLVLTGDTFGTAGRLRDEIPCDLQIVVRGGDKAAVARSLEGGVAAIGNGRNDVPMFEAAVLAIGILGPEGLAREALLTAHIVVPDIAAAMGLLLEDRRIVGTLRP